MTGHLTEDEVLAALPGLTRPRLFAFIETRLVMPLRQEAGDPSAHAFRQVDFARLQLLCELTDDLGLDDGGLGVVMRLIDQLHATRQDLLAIARAVEAEPPDVRTRIGSAVIGLRGLSATAGPP
jgi:chaperone modulatory protein CbpM